LVFDLVDSHCHLAGAEFQGDLEDVIGRAISAGLVHALVILAADDEMELERAEAVRSRWTDVRFSIGVHPHAAAAYAAQPDGAAAVVESALAAQPLARAIGEIGLDYHYDFAPRDVQREVFRHQIRLARRRGLPIVVHTREADDDTFRILDEENARDTGAVLHCFTGTREAARRALDLGFHISLAGIVTFPRALELKEVARMVPLDRLLIETDSPFLAPVPYRGKRNEPSHVVRVAQAVAELRGVSAAAIGEAARNNFRRLFNP
jgi:TatD DNase family protein